MTVPTLIVAAPAPPEDLERLGSQSLLNAGMWTARHRPLDVEADERPAGDISFIDSGPPLRVHAPLVPRS